MCVRVRVCACVAWGRCLHRYWTIIPPMIEMFFRAHPRGAALHTRSVMAAGLVWVWSLRLTHSYFRREEWQFGGREDWRFTQMRKQYGWNWAWISFFAAFLSQQVRAAAAHPAHERPLSHVPFPLR